jgi:hypothetical protein
MNYQNNDIIATSSFASHSMISLDAVLKDVFRIIEQNGDVMSIDDIRESAAFAASHLYNYKFYELALCIRPLNNFKTAIPDYYSIESVWYNEGLNDTDVYTESVQVKDIILNEEGIGKLTPKDVYFVKKSFSRYSWKPATMGHTVSGMMGMRDRMHDLNSSITSSTEYSENPYLRNVPGEFIKTNVQDCCNTTFSISDCILTLNKESGYVAIIYKRVTTDENGSPLIPNIPIVFEAIRAYVMWEIFERESFLHREGSDQKAMKWQDRWEKLSMNASGKLMMPSLPEWVSMISTTRMMTNDPFERHYDYFWGNEQFNFGPF